MGQGVRARRAGRVRRKSFATNGLRFGMRFATEKIQKYFEVGA